MKFLRNQMFTRENLSKFVYKNTKNFGILRELR